MPESNYSSNHQSILSSIQPSTYVFIDSYNHLSIIYIRLCIRSSTDPIIHRCVCVYVCVCVCVCFCVSAYGYDVFMRMRVSYLYGYVWICLGVHAQYVYVIVCSREYFNVYMCVFICVLYNFDHSNNKKINKKYLSPTAYNNLSSKSIE